jgi:outer membrane assembly lipoprotein YfiO
MRQAYLLLLLIPLTLAAIARADEKKTWEFQNGNWAPVSTPTTEPIAEPTLDRAEELLFHNRYEPAREMLLAWEKTNKRSLARDRCIYLLAEAFYQDDNRIKAFYYLDELMDEYPDSGLFYPALQKQYEIADAYLGGYKEKLLGMRILDRSDEGVEMMYRIQQRSPGSPLAEKSLLRTADYYFSDQDYDVAQDAYTFYARNYPRSPEIPRVRLRAAFASLAQFNGVLYDPTAIIDARAQLVDIQRKYPELAAEENVSSVIEQIDSAFARKILETAHFYERTHEIKGAVYQYRFLANTYPNSPEGIDAKRQLAKCPPSALNEPPPPSASGYAPATEPSNITELSHP